MQPFVLLFRLGRRLPEADLKNRDREVRAWAQRQIAAGHKLDPRMLAPESYWRSPDGDTGPAPTNGGGPVTALLFLEAEDMEQARQIAASHPGLRYGASVEVRAWFAPGAVPAVPRP